jgi:DNA polymerase (family 10)
MIPLLVAEIAGAYAKHKLTREDVQGIAKLLRPVIKRYTTRFEIAGSYRRGATKIGDLDFILTNAKLLPMLSDIGEKIQVLKSPRLGDKVITLVCRWGKKEVQVEFLSVPDKSFGAALLHSTGSGAFNMEMRTYARQKGFLLNQYGLFKEDGKRVAGATEEGIFNKLQHAWIPPTDRESFWRVKSKYKLS